MTPKTYQTLLLVLLIVCGWMTGLAIALTLNLWMSP